MRGGAEPRGGLIALALLAVVACDERAGDAEQVAVTRPTAPDAAPPAPDAAPVPAVVDFHAIPADTLTRPRFDQFVDVGVCAQCHADRHTQWKGSTHGRAGGPPSPTTVVAPFDGRVLRFTNATVRPERRGKRYLFRLKTDQDPEREVMVAAVVGAARIHGGGAQSYFERQADGRLLNLPFEWSRNAATWFCQTNDRRWRPIDGSYPLEACNWPPSRTLGTGPGRNCQNCHGSQIRLLFDERARRYEVQYSTLAIDCQSCHGPGRAHVDWARAGGGGADIGLEPLSLLDRDASVELCLRCHANKQQVSTGFLPGASFAAHYAVGAIRPLQDPKIRADGQLTGFGYQQAHLYSPCYLEGSMTCVDCHAPHTLTYRDVFGRGLEGRFDDGQCVGCHAAKAGAAHAGHAEARCTDCHMRLRQHGGIGRDIPLARADHAITIPRPDAKAEVGSACADCHPQRAPTAGLEQLFGRLKPRTPLVASLLREPPDIPGVVAALAALDDDAPLAATGGIGALLGSVLSSRAPLDQRARDALERLAGARRVEVRAVALAALLVAGGPSAEPFAHRVIAGAGADRPALRALVAHNLMASDYAFASVGRDVAAQLRRLLVEVALPLALDPTLALPIIGSTFASGRDWPRALALFDRAIALPAPADGKVPLGLGGPRFQLLGMRAEALLNMNRLPAAVATYERAVAAFPQSARNTEGLCRLLVRTGAQWKAIDCLAALLRLVPADTESRLVRAELLEAAGRRPEALAEAKRALQFDPTSTRGAALRDRIQRQLRK